MKVYVVVHEKVEKSGENSNIRLFLTQEAAKNDMCMGFAYASLDYDGVVDIEAASDDDCWGSSTKRKFVWNGKVRETWRIEEHELDVSAAIKVKGGMVQAVAANAGIDVEVYDLDVSSYPDEGEEDEADRKAREFAELLGRPDWRCVW